MAVSGDKRRVTPATRLRRGNSGWSGDVLPAWRTTESAGERGRSPGTEGRIEARAAGPRLLTVADVEGALAAPGTTITRSGGVVRNRLLGVDGRLIVLDRGSVEAHGYRSAAERVADEQILLRREALLATFMIDGGSERVTSVRNLLLVYRAGEPGVASAVQRAARALATAASER